MLVGLISGLASLTYGGFILVLATLTLSAVLRKELRRRGRLWVSILMAWLAFASPLLIWRAYVVRVTGNFHVHETADYHQFVWVAETLEAGVSFFFGALTQNLIAFIHTLPAALAALCGITLAGTFQIFRAREIFPEWSRDLRIPIVSFFLSAVPFFALMGYYAFRLTWELVPPLLLLLSLILGAIHQSLSVGHRKLLAVGLVTISIAYAAYIVISDQTTYFAQIL